MRHPISAFLCLVLGAPHQHTDCVCQKIQLPGSRDYHFQLSALTLVDFTVCTTGIRHAPARERCRLATNTLNTRTLISVNLLLHVSHHSQLPSSGIAYTTRKKARFSLFTVWRDPNSEPSALGRCSSSSTPQPSSSTPGQKHRDRSALPGTRSQLREAAGGRLPPLRPALPCPALPAGLLAEPPLPAGLTSEQLGHLADAARDVGRQHGEVLLVALEVGGHGDGGGGGRGGAAPRRAASVFCSLQKRLPAARTALGTGFRRSSLPLLLLFWGMDAVSPTQPLAVSR